jgi:hypothetical protein
MASPPTIKLTKSGKYISASCLNVLLDSLTNYPDDWSHRILPLADILDNGEVSVRIRHDGDFYIGVGTGFSHRSFTFRNREHDGLIFQAAKRIIAERRRRSVSDHLASPVDHIWEEDESGRPR